jgi:hypothetical protein
MSDVFINMNRTICRRAVRRGRLRAAYAVTARFNAASDAAALSAHVDTLLVSTAVASGEVWTAFEPGGVPVSTEERLRGGDKKIAACLMIDTLRQDAAEQTGARLATQFPQAEIGVFRVLCQLGRGDL